MTSRARDAQPTELEITPHQGLFSIEVRELWQYRELLFLMAWRDATVRYKQSVVGVGWAVIQPVMMMIIFSIIFGRFARLPSEGVPYALFTLCALVPWNYFSRSLADSSNSLVGASHLITKIYFPRLILPISRVLAGGIDFAIAFALLVGMMAWYGFTPSRGIVMLPLFIALAMFTALGAGLWLTALNVKYRDVGFVIPFLLQAWLYASPVAYSTTIVPERWRVIYGLNPMTGVIEGFRWAMLGGAPPDSRLILSSAAMVIVVVVTGLYYFRRVERTFADLI